MVVSVREVTDEDGLMIITKKGVVIRLPVRDLRTIGRNTQGVRMINVATGDKVVDVSLVPMTEDEDEAEESAGDLDQGEDNVAG